MLCRRPTTAARSGRTSSSSSTSSAAPLRARPAAASARRRGRPLPAAAAAAADDADAGPANASATSADAGEAEWRRLDKKVNTYPCLREFKAIGADEIGDDGSTFAAAMARCVTSVVGPIHLECVNAVPSRSGAYLAVRIGPVYVKSPEDVIAIFKNFKADPRCKFAM